MMNKSPPDSPETEIMEIRRIIRNRESTYGRVKVTTALVKWAGNWKLVLARYAVLPSDDLTEYAKSFDYDDFHLHENTVTIEQFLSLLESIEHDGTLRVPGSEGVSVNGRIQKWPNTNNHQPSSESAFNLDWPADSYAFMAMGEYQAQAPSGPFAVINQPLFDTGQAAMNFFFEMQTGYFSYPGAALIFLPNYTARIREIRLGPSSLVLRIETGKGVLATDLLAKIYLESQTRIAQVETLFTGNEAQVPFEYQPNLYLLYLFSLRTGEVLDYRRFGIGWGGSSQDVFVESSPESIEQLIRSGENKQVEFKQVIPKNWSEFAETAVSMSNGNGGTILLGVDDNGQVVGVQDPKVSDSIHDALRNLCEPAIEPKIEMQILREKTIGVIQIPEGTAKPYILKDKGVYVRFGATDRLASREEIVNLVEQKSRLQ